MGDGPLTLEFDPTTATIFFHDEDNLVVRHASILLHVSRRPMKVAALKELARAVGARGPTVLVATGAYMNVIEGTERAMNAALREEQFALFRQLLEPEAARVATIVPAGFIVRGALKVLSLGASASYRTFKRPREAAEWVSEFVAVPVPRIRGFVAWGRQL